jgi:hypothetical protein
MQIQDLPKPEAKNLYARFAISADNSTEINNILNLNIHHSPISYNDFISKIKQDLGIQIALCHKCRAVHSILSNL